MNSFPAGAFLVLQSRHLRNCAVACRWLPWRRMLRCHFRFCIHWCVWRVLLYHGCDWLTSGLLYQELGSVRVTTHKPRGGWETRQSCSRKKKTEWNDWPRKRDIRQRKHYKICSSPVWYRRPCAPLSPWKPLEWCRSEDQNWCCLACETVPSPWTSPDLSYPALLPRSLREGRQIEGERQGGRTLIKAVDEKNTDESVGVFISISYHLFSSAYLCHRVRAKWSPEAGLGSPPCRRQHEHTLRKGKRAKVGEKRAQLCLGQREKLPRRGGDWHLDWQGERKRRLQEGWRDWVSKKREEAGVKDMLLSQGHKCQTCWDLH